LQNAVDLVIEDTPVYLGQIEAVAPDTPQLLYANTSNLYLDLLTDWLAYADATGAAREGAFYHVATATPFAGDSPSSQPVTWFWRAYRGGAALTDRTAQARGTQAGGVAFGAAGEAVYLGYPERFRELNLHLASGAAAGWSARWEYPSAVDAAGNPTAWAALTPVADTTAGLRQSGRVSFDPPANWKAATLAGSARLFYVRSRTLTAGTAPVAATILGRDYVGANGTTAGTIPAFDAAADANGDGYLSDAEYARRAAGRDARFVYESRAFYGTYGQMRFATNPGHLGFRNWAVASARRWLGSQPLADGLFVDNSSGKAPVPAGAVLEPVAAYASEYAALLGAIGREIAPRWLLANTAGGGPSADAVVQRVPAYFEEFALRPLAHHYLQFEDLAATVARRAALTSPAPLTVLDSLPTGGSPTDARTQLATLASYYLLADPETTFLDFYGGYEPATAWARHWSPAAAYDIGRPNGTWSLLATGADPANPGLTYRVYQRSFANAVVLYKPLSYANNVTGTLSTGTATTHALGATYHVLQADGTLGAAVTSVSLRNGEGIILVRAAAGPLSLAGASSPPPPGAAGSSDRQPRPAAGYAFWMPGGGDFVQGPVAAVGIVPVPAVPESPTPTETAAAPGANAADVDGFFASLGREDRRFTSSGTQRQTLSPADEGSGNDLLDELLLFA
jgi:hypothetical protein